MTDDQALEEAIRRTGVQRYRHLCSDANTLPSPNAPADWRRFVRSIAEGPLPMDFPLVVGNGRPATPVVVHYADPDAPRPCGGCPGSPVAL